MVNFKRSRINQLISARREVQNCSRPADMKDWTFPVPAPRRPRINLNRVGRCWCGRPQRAGRGSPGSICPRPGAPPLPLSPQEPSKPAALPAPQSGLLLFWAFYAAFKCVVQLQANSPFPFAQASGGSARSAPHQRKRNGSLGGAPGLRRESARLAALTPAFQDLVLSLF